MKTKTRKTNTAHLFFQGMGTIGQIFPSVRQPSHTDWASAWQGVGDAFAANNLYVKEVAAKAGVKKGIIDNWLSASKTKEPRAIDLYAVCRAAHITMEEAVDGEAGERYLRELVREKGWVFKPPERIVDIVDAIGELSDEQLGYVRRLVKAMLNGVEKGDPR